MEFVLGMATGVGICGWVLWQFALAWESDAAHYQEHIDWLTEQRLRERQREGRRQFGKDADFLYRSQN